MGSSGGYTDERRRLNTKCSVCLRPKCFRAMGQTCLAKETKFLNFGIRTIVTSLYQSDVVDKLTDMMVEENGSVRAAP